MAKILKGRPVSAKMTEETAEKVKILSEKGIIPTLAVVRVGSKSDDIFYEKSILAKGDEAGVAVKLFHYKENIDGEEFLKEIEKLNRDETVNGVLIFRPLPSQIDDAAVCRLLDPKKDADGITPGSMGGVFTGSGEGFPPCTAQACIEILDYYGLELEGRKTAVIGRSLVVGRPVAAMALERNATVTLCHSRTPGKDMKEVLRKADIIIAAVGKLEMIKGDDIGEDQVILDVGINADEEGRMRGDVAFEEAEKKAACITPVPGGVGSVTTAVLMRHVVKAAERKANL
ncbi:MAG TPA: bifunctional 5,10-methylenetetrahydrofolate dehydrogenase/5,10-methenyltetrahydrofolate cyclohydrolase [Candidatus Copromorpha excrementigallinarum]|uniref:Bifunctional protein FolD n=1 Tax=Candidatus Allocopromorpha excrementigallinarum TaxID=2840742 RepID=A0A9D1I0D4_9FIRM|nr:bifunctional 5,10-methylenetetrahydrofolate dehydrogenase/5,10-methenyltetrahydrofolate cyclohydrolase [Candidatus Copromorpha excrementigallinarum]